MSVSMSILAILDEAPSYGLQIRNEFEARTGSILPLNVGQVYSTLARLERDGLVASRPSETAERIYEITDEGRATVRRWFFEPTLHTVPNRDELVLKLVMAAGRTAADIVGVIQAERKAAVQLLQEYTRLKRDADEDTDLGWLFLVDSLIFQTEARVRWLDACEARQQRTRGSRRAAEGALQKEKVSR